MSQRPKVHHSLLVFYQQSSNLFPLNLKQLSQKGSLCKFTDTLQFSNIVSAINACFLEKIADFLFNFAGETEKAIVLSGFCFGRIHCSPIKSVTLLFRYFSKSMLLLFARVLTFFKKVSKISLSLASNTRHWKS